jgi:hypothetical protein
LKTRQSLDADWWHFFIKSCGFSLLSSNSFSTKIPAVMHRRKRFAFVGSLNMRFHDSLASMKSACKSAINLMANFYRKIRKKTQSLSSRETDYSRKFISSLSFMSYGACLYKFPTPLSDSASNRFTFHALIRSSFNVAQSRWFAMTS